MRRRLRIPLNSETVGPGSKMPERRRMQVSIGRASPDSQIASRGYGRRSARSVPAAHDLRPREAGCGADRWRWSGVDGIDDL
jgi:hypothetical protein